MLPWFHIRFLDFVDRGWLHTTSSVLTRPWCTYSLLDIGHECCVLTSPAEQDRRGWGKMLGQLWHLTAFSTSIPANRHWRQSDSDFKMKLAEHFETKSWTLGFYFDVSYLQTKNLPSWTKHVLRRLVPLHGIPSEDSKCRKCLFVCLFVCMFFNHLQASYSCSINTDATEVLSLLLVWALPGAAMLIRFLPLRNRKD